MDQILSRYLIAKIGLVNQYPDSPTLISEVFEVQDIKWPSELYIARASNSLISTKHQMLFVWACTLVFCQAVPEESSSRNLLYFLKETIATHKQVRMKLTAYCYWAVIAWLKLEPEVILPQKQLGMKNDNIVELWHRVGAYVGMCKIGCLWM